MTRTLRDRLAEVLGPGNDDATAYRQADAVLDVLREEDHRAMRDGAFDRGKARDVLRKRLTSPDMPLVNEDDLLDRLAECVQDEGEPTKAELWDSWRSIADRLNVAEARLARIAALCDEAREWDKNDADSPEARAARAYNSALAAAQAILGDTGPGVTLTREEATLAAEAFRIGQDVLDDYANQFSDVDARLDEGRTRADAARMRALAVRLEREAGHDLRP